MAVLINSACHNTTLRGDNKQIHGDWAGCAREFIEADHPGTIAMLSIGCGGDSDPNEVVVDYALRMKREINGSRLWINAYTNDVSYYIPSNRLLKEGGYEVNESLATAVTYGWPERLQPALEDRIVEAVRALLPGRFLSPAK